MKIIVGLGNPGKKYEGTRHNVGFDVLRKIAEKQNADPLKAQFESLTTECRFRPVGGGAEGLTERLLLAWPQTFMNRSGVAVRQASQFYKVNADAVLVVCDDFHLPVGKLRTRAGGSAGGQNGLKDIIQQLGTDQFPRLRVGVGPLPEGWDQAGFVLGKFGKQDRDLIEETISRAADAALCWAEAGAAEAMNRFN